MNARFGPAGNSDSFSAKYKSTLSAPEYLAEIGLDHYEYQCGRGVKVSDSLAQSLRAKAEKYGITLSVHAPYFISLSSVEKEKRDNSIDYILQTCDAAKRLGAERIVIHSGSCSKMTREEALALAKDTLSRARREATDRGFGEIVFCPETMGKVNQLGDLAEVLELCRLDDSFLPCIDFGHLNARGFGCINDREDYSAVLDMIADRLGAERQRIFHSHFSKIMYTVPGGEKKHLNFDDCGEFGPDHEPLLELIAEKGLSPVIICESAGHQTEDALTMKQHYLSALQEVKKKKKKYLSSTVRTLICSESGSPEFTAPTPSTASTTRSSPLPSKRGSTARSSSPTTRARSSTSSTLHARASTALSSTPEPTPITAMPSATLSLQ